MNPFWESSDGRHVVYCCDNRAIIGDLPQAALVVTDPPYQIGTALGKTGVYANRDVLANINKMGIDSFTPADFLPAIWGNCNHAYVFCSKGSLLEYLEWMKREGIESWDLITIAKRNPIPAKNNKYLPDTELCFFMRGKGCYWKQDAPYDYYRKVKWVDVKPPAFDHPTEKAEHVIGQMLELSSRVDDLILDPFLGSGTTSAVAARMGRRSIGIEMSEKYAAIASQRIQNEIDQLALFPAEARQKHEQPSLAL